MELGNDDLLDDLESAANRTGPAASAIKGISADAATAVGTDEGLDSDLFGAVDDSDAAASSAPDTGFNFDAYIASQNEPSGGGGLFD